MHATIWSWRTYLTEEASDVKTHSLTLPVCLYVRDTWVLCEDITNKIRLQAEEIIIFIVVVLTASVV
jgi:hypothetical protein